MGLVNLYLGLGSNLGDRRENLQRALELLDEAFGTHYTALSDIVETPAWGFDGPPFLNTCVLYRLGRKGTPEAHATEILDICKAVERALGRRTEGERDAGGKRVYHDRPMDIDILFYGAETIQTERLTIPHPGVGERDFVRIPLAQIAKPSLKKAFPEIFD